MREVAAALVLCVAWPLAAFGDDSPFERVKLAGDAGSPDAAFDASGVLHVAFARGKDAYVARLAPGADALDEPVRANAIEGSVQAARERGPKLAVGRSGSIHVVWMHATGKGLSYARSGDGGRTFAPERNLLDRDAAVDGATVAADGRGRVFAVWLDNRLGEDPKSPVSNAPFLARSEDDGATWGENEAIRSSYPGRLCACCQLDAAVGPDGRLAVAGRGAYEAMRDPVVLQGDEKNRRFAGVVASADGWRLRSCPMSGPSVFLRAKAPKALVAWMSEGRVYWTGQAARGTFAPRAAAGDGREQRYPLVLAADGDAPGGGGPGLRVLVAWVEGGDVRYALFDGKGARRAAGSAGPIGERTRPAGAVSPGGRFYLAW